MKANEWVSYALKAIGGKGGGKPGLAQGSVSSNIDNTSLDVIMNESNSFLKQYISQ